MSNPTPIYVVSYGGTALPGYVISEDLPIVMKVPASEILGRDGGVSAHLGAQMRSINITMRLLSTLSTGSGLDHLNNCKNQWRAALATLIDTVSPAQLKIGETDRYISATFMSSTEPLTSDGSSTRTSYSVTFQGNPPYFLGTAIEDTTALSGATGTSTTIIGDTRKTYPSISIASGITRITLTQAATGKSITLEGTHASPWIVNCATLQITHGGLNAVSFLTSSPNFGFYQIGAGTLTLDITNGIGTGDVVVTLQPRYGR